MRQIRQIGVLCAAAGVTVALLAQFTSTGLKTHYVLVLLLFSACLLLLRGALAHLTRRAAVASLLWGGGLSLAYLSGIAFKTETGILPQVHWTQLLLRFGGMALFFAALLCNLMAWQPRFCKLGAPERMSVRQRRRWFLGVWAIIALCWLPYWLYFHPCIVSGDTLVQYGQVLSGEYANAHPVLHTLSLGFATRVAKWLGMGEAQGFAGYALVQLLCLSAVCAQVVLALCERLRGSWPTALAVAYFALNPLHAAYSITLWKDIPFSALVTLLALQLLRVAETRGAYLEKRGAFARLVAVLTLLPFVRGNGILVSSAALIALIRGCAAMRKKIACAAAGILAFFLLLQGPVFSALHVRQPHMTETLGVPLQQVGLVAKKGLALSEEQTRTLERVIPYKALAEDYSPLWSDPIKLDPRFQHEELRAHLPAYAKLWGEIGLRYPETYMEAYGMLSYRYWYPDQALMFGYEWNYSQGEWSDFVKTKPLVPAFAFLWQTDVAKWSQVPVVSLLFSEGLQIWYILAVCACAWAGRKSRYLLALLPVLAVWVPLMLGLPYAETRYIYALYLCLPLTIGLFFIAKQQPLDEPR